MDEKFVSAQTLRRLPAYLHYLYAIRGKRRNISATALSDAFGLNDVQVRKDLAAVCGSGRPKTGYLVEDLIAALEEALGCGTETKTVLIGAGNLGKALLSYEGFKDYGLNIVAAFDTDPQIAGLCFGGKPVLRLGELPRVCCEQRIRLGIITVPMNAAQGVCDELVSLGVRAIWNFAPTILKVPEGVLVENENLASSLAILSKHLRAAEDRFAPLHPGDGAPLAWKRASEAYEGEQRNFKTESRMKAQEPSLAQLPGKGIENA